MKPRAFIAGIAALAALAGSTASFAETAASLEYKRLTNELRVKQQSMPADDFFILLERSFKDFVERYPNTKESGEVNLGLGQIYSGRGSHAKAIEHLQAGLKSPAAQNASLAASAKMMLAKSNLALERFDEAERLLRDAAKAAPGVDQRIVEGAKAELARVGALRRTKIGSPAVNVAGTSHTGQAIDLSKYRGKVVLLDFWAAWCGPCRQEMPNVIKTYNEFKKKGFEIIGVSLDEDKNAFNGFIRDNKMEWPQLFEGRGWGSGIAKCYAVNAIPATFLVDRKGVLRYKNVRGPALREAVEKLLAEK